MARQTKERVLIDQLSFNFEENIVEHYYKRPKEKELINTTFKKEFSAIKQNRKSKKRRILYARSKSRNS